METATGRDYVEYYGQGGKSKLALFRLSVWEASERRCHICHKQLTLPETHLDHIIPKSLKDSEFDAIWAAYAPGQPNNGKNHVTNIRAACALCNSPHTKGDEVLIPTALSLILGKSPEFEKDVRKFQDRIFRLGPYAQAAVLVADVQGPDDVDTLMTPSITEALIDALGTAVQRRADGLVEPAAFQVDLFSTDRARISVFISQKTHRSLLAGQMLSGHGLSDSLTEVVIQTRRYVWREAEHAYIEQLPPHLAASAGIPEWDIGEFVIDIFDVELDAAKLSYSFDFSCQVSQTVNFFVASQSDDGGNVEGFSTTIEVESVVTGAALVNNQAVSVECETPRVSIDLH